MKFEVWSAKSAVCSVRCGVSREGHGRDRVSLNYRSFMFGKLPPPACPGLCYYSNLKMQFEILAGLGPFIFAGITLLILRGHCVGNSCYSWKTICASNCAGVLAVASKPHALAYKMGGCYQDGLMYGVLLYKSPKHFARRLELLCRSL